ncbi:3',5'-cyclic nucleotide phosphodiesterase [Polynucleobacter paneuropaeus]|nr:3',5'-cyclic nucleotide phosphodiesterase [Polynucleobacter paneuropaeus]MBT8590192.1 3',5'-cyclic nucleotide phosphodiesterase [Polynucleobacter paneuropaeus]MBT8595814.1 3',5'-cyclic nucleotide phosphodiesterase [Polynucleobacter paneuropaeus]
MQNSFLDIRSAMNALLDSKRLSHSPQFLEATLDLIESGNGDFKTFILALLETSFWMNQDFLGNPFKNLCSELADEIDHFALAHDEPAYHSRSHFKDVCLMISYLLLQQEAWPETQRINNSWYVSREESWFLFYAAIAHDFAHPGLINQTPYEIEQNSLDLLRKHFLDSSTDQRLYEPILEVISPWILATDHAFYQKQLDRASHTKPDHADCLAMLLVEADLLSSALPKRGLELTYQLSQEWQANYPDKALALRNEVGYLNFLRSLQFLSPHALSAKIPQILNNSLIQLRTQLS